MTQRLAIPAWSSPPCPLDAWAGAFSARGHAAQIEIDTDDEANLVVESLGLDGFASLEGGQAVAIDFDIDADDEAAALALLGEVAASLGWELHDETDDD